MATEAPPRRRRFWGWGYEDQQPAHAEVETAAAGIVSHLGLGERGSSTRRGSGTWICPPLGLTPPSALEPVCPSDPHARASYALGKAHRDVVRAFRGRFDHVPDVVASPRDERELESILFAEALRAAKRAVDPQALLNPGVLIDPERGAR